MEGGVRTAAVILVLLLLAGCSFSAGIGFRKTPWVAQPQVMPETEKALTAMVAGLSPGQIELAKMLLSLFGMDRWVEVAPYAFRENEQATVGAWLDFSTR